MARYRKSRKSARRSRRRTRHSRRTKRRSVVPYNVSTNFGGFPRTKMIKLRYNEYVTINAAAGALASYAFRCNSIHDPNSTGGGHQPMGHDTWAEIYNTYVVVGSKLTANFTSGGAQLPQAMLAILQDDDATLTSTSTSEIIERGGSRFRIVPDSGSAVGKAITLSSKFSAKKYYEIANIKDNVSRLGAAFGANPAEMAYFLLVVGPPDQATDISTWGVNVTIDYLVLVSDPKDMLQS